MTARMKLDVYGTPMLAEHTPAGWRIFRWGNEGKRLPLDIVVPDCIGDDEIAQYLDDLFHEAATPAHPCVRRLADW